MTPILVGFVKLGWASVRIELRGEKKYRELVETGQPVVFALWHEGIMVIGWYVARLLAEGVKATFLISPSVDGEIGVEILARFVPALTGILFVEALGYPVERVEHRRVEMGVASVRA